MIRSLLSVLLVLAFSAALATAVWAEPQALFYHRAAGTTANYKIQMHASIPTQGERDVIVKIAEKAVSSEGDGFHAEAVLDMTGQGVPPGHGQGRYRVDREGDMSELSMLENADKTQVLDARNLALLYMPMPGTSVDVGAGWSGQRVMYTPDLNVPIQVPPLKLVINCKLKAWEDSAAGKVAVVQVSATNAPGESNTAQMDGTLRYDQQAGRVLSCSMSGTMKVKVAFTRITVPFSLSVASE